MQASACVQAGGCGWMRVRQRVCVCVWPKDLESDKRDNICEILHKKQGTMNKGQGGERVFLVRIPDQLSQFCTGPRVLPWDPERNTGSEEFVKKVSGFFRKQLPEENATDARAPSNPRAENTPKGSILQMRVDELLLFIARKNRRIALFEGSGLPFPADGKHQRS